MSELVRFEVEDGIGVITVDNPPVNALSPGVPEGILESVAKGNKDPNVKAMVLMGAGRSFIAGADIRQFGIEGKDAVVELSVKLIGTRGGRINAAKIFRASVPAPTTAGGAAAAAVNDALAAVLVDVVRWTSTKI